MFIRSFSNMNCSCEEEVKTAEIFRKENGDLINKTEMRKHHLDERQKIPCSPCKYGKTMWKLTVHKITEAA